MEREGDQASDHQLQYQNMSHTLDTIQEEAIRLLGFCENNMELKEGLNLIISLSRYKSDVRTKNEKERSKLKENI